MAELLSSLHSPGRSERTVAAPFGEVPVAAFARYIAFDGLVHGWDLSRANGCPTNHPTAWCAKSMLSLDSSSCRGSATEKRSPPRPRPDPKRASSKSSWLSAAVRSTATPTKRRQCNDLTLTSEDIGAIKGRQQATWSSGDYAVIGTTLQIVGETLCEAVDVTAGSRVLDVAAGNGNASLAAARGGCAVTALDYVETFLEGAQRRALPKA